MGISLFFILFTSFKVFSIELQENLYDRLYNDFQHEYHQIGQERAHSILKNKNFAITGGLNSIGFSINRPFGDFGLVMDRNLAPDLMSDSRWIVTDTFAIHIDVSKLMHKLSKQNLFDLRESELKAFAGLEFKRIFTWVHYAENYEAGLTSQLEKLFFPYQMLKLEKIQSLANGEMIIKEDSLALKSGLSLSAQVYSGFAVSALAMGRYERLSRLEVSALEEGLQISLEKTSLTMAGISVRLQAMIIKALAMALITYDFQYESSNSFKLYTQIKPEQLNDSSPVILEFDKILKGKEADRTQIAPYIISQESRSSKKKAAQSSFLFWGKKRISETSEVEFVNDNVVKKFFRHRFEKVYLREQIFSGIFARIFSAVTQKALSGAKTALETRRLEVEYESQNNLLDNKERLDANDKLSFIFGSKFLVKKSDSEKKLTKAIYILESYSSINSETITFLQNGTISAPLEIHGNFVINRSGLNHFNSLDPVFVFDTLEAVCVEKPPRRFFNFRSIRGLCKKNLMDDYVDYWKDLKHEKITFEIVDNCTKKARKYFLLPGKQRAYLKSCLEISSVRNKLSSEIPLWTLTKLAEKIVNNSFHKVHFYNLFGVANVFFHGHVEATTEAGKNYLSYFHEGQFQGLGAVDQYMRESNLRSSSLIIKN